MAGRVLRPFLRSVGHSNLSTPVRTAAQLALRPFMPGGESPNFPKFLKDPIEGFPITVCIL